MDEKSNVEFHLATSSNGASNGDVHIEFSNEKTAGEEESIDISGKTEKDKFEREDYVDYVGIAKTLSSTEKKLKFSRLLKQAAPEKKILALGVMFTFFGRYISNFTVYIHVIY